MGCKLSVVRHSAPFVLASMLCLTPVAAGFGRGPAAVAFDDVATAAGVANAGDPGAVAWMDVDNDGDEDLFVAALGKDRFYRNDGGGVFSKMRGSGLEKTATSSFGAFARPRPAGSSDWHSQYTAMPIGTFTRKIQCQLSVLVSTPPSSTPMLPPPEHTNP